MKFFIEDLCVRFPFIIIFPEQVQFMYILKKLFDKKTHGIMGVPPGMGFSLTTISFFVSYNLFSPKKRKLIYCTRTEEEKNFVIEQSDFFLKNLSIFFGFFEPIFFFKIISILEKKVLCIHPFVKKKNELEEIEDFCNSLMASYMFLDKKKKISKNKKNYGIGVSPECFFFLKFLEKKNKVEFKGVWSTIKLRKHGIKNRVCPFYFSREIILNSNIIIGCTKQIFFSDFFSSFEKKNLRTSFLLFDNNYDIEVLGSNICSFELNRLLMSDCERGILLLKKKFFVARSNSYKKRINFDFNFTDVVFENETFGKFIPKIKSQKFFDKKKIKKNLFSKGLNFIRKKSQKEVHKIFYFFDSVIKIISFFKSNLNSYLNIKWNIEEFISNFFKNSLNLEISNDSIRFFFQYLREIFFLLGYLHSRKINGLLKLLEFLRVIGIQSDTSNENMEIYFSPMSQKFPLMKEPKIMLFCSETSFISKEFLERFSCIVFCVFNCLDLDFFFFILDFKPGIHGYLRNFFEKFFLFSSIVDCGTGSFNEIRNKTESKNHTFIKKCSSLLNKIIEVIPEGIICFFPSIFKIQELVEEWKKEKFLSKILNNRKIFVESFVKEENIFIIEEYKICCDFGIKAIFLGIFGGILTQANLGIHYSRGVIAVSSPLENENFKIEILLKNSRFFIRKRNYENYRNFYLIREYGYLINKNFKSKKDFGILVILHQNKRFQKKKPLKNFYSFNVVFEKSRKIEEIIKKINKFFNSDWLHLF